MLDTAGNLYERLLKSRLEAAINEADQLSSRQHGFRHGRSNLGAIRNVIENVEVTHRSCLKYEQIFLLATLDVQQRLQQRRIGENDRCFKSNFENPRLSQFCNFNSLFILMLLRQRAEL
uniref:Reverse transcriptase domain-containing protein n=1 Tax=Bactrocera dorsalis TaxID=27457 RepID=A0A034VAV6_BACDO